MDYLEEWIEYDYNPFIIFNKDGRVIFANSEAQFLLGFNVAKDIYELTLSYASASYGFKTTVMDLEYGKYNFYAITVGYKDENEIGIKLYKKPNTSSFKIDKNATTKINIYSTLDLSISTSSITSNAVYEKVLDPTFPEIYLNLDQFLKLLSKIYYAFRESKKIETKLSLATGEYIVFENRKYPIFSITVSGDVRDKESDTYIKELAKNTQGNIYLKNSSIILELPLIS